MVTAGLDEDDSERKPPPATQWHNHNHNRVLLAPTSRTAGTLSMATDTAWSNPTKKQANRGVGTYQQAQRDLLALL